MRLREMALIGLEMTGLEKSLSNEVTKIYFFNLDPVAWEIIISLNVTNQLRMG